MGWSAGLFSRLYGATGWRTDELAGTGIESIRHDEHDQVLSDGINSCIHKGGQNAATADLPMGTYKHTNVGNAAARNQYAALGQIQDLSRTYIGATSGTSSAYTATATPSIISLVKGMRISCEFDEDNASGALTLNLNTIGAKSIKTKQGRSSFFAGEFKANKSYDFDYDGTDFIVQNLDPSTHTWDYGTIGTDGGAFTLGTSHYKKFKIIDGRVFFDATFTGSFASSANVIFIPYAMFVADNTYYTVSSLIYDETGAVFLTSQAYGYDTTQIAVRPIGLGSYSSGKTYQFRVAGSVNL